MSRSLSDSVSTPAAVAEVTRTDAALRRFLFGLPGVDQVGADARAAALSTRSIKAASKAFAIDLAISMIDLTTLEGSDTPGKVTALCAKGMRPDPTDPSVPSTAAICVYNDMVGIAKDALGDSGVKVVVGLRKGGASWSKVEKAGLQVRSSSIEEKIMWKMKKFLSFFPDKTINLLRKT